MQAKPLVKKLARLQVQGRKQFAMPSKDEFLYPSG